MRLLTTLPLESNNANAGVPGEGRLVVVLGYTFALR